MKEVREKWQIQCEIKLFFCVGYVAGVRRIEKAEG